MDRREREREREREKREGGCSGIMKKEDKSLIDVEHVETTGERCRHLSWRTPLNSSLFTFIGMKHISPTFYVYHTNVFEADNIYKNPPPNVISQFFCYFYFALGLHPWLCWLLERSQIPSCPRQLQTCARLHARLGGVGRVSPPNENPGYAGAWVIVISAGSLMLDQLW